MKIIVAGGREFNNKEIIFRCLDSVGIKKEYTIISGHATGVDSMAELYAKERGLTLEIYPAQWDKYGKKAGPMRNHEMACNGDALIAFWDGSSRGTKNMLRHAVTKRLSIIVFDYNGNQIGRSEWTKKLL